MNNQTILIANDKINKILFINDDLKFYNLSSKCPNLYTVKPHRLLKHSKLEKPKQNSYSKYKSVNKLSI